MSFSFKSVEDEDYVITKPDENALFKLQLALGSVEERITAGGTAIELEDARDMLQSQIELLEHILTAEDESERAELEEEFLDLVRSTEEVRRRWLASEDVN